MNRFRLSTILILGCLSVLSAAVPDERSEWMLTGDSGRTFYIDGVNLDRVWPDGAVMYYKTGIRVPPGEALLIENGVSCGIRNNLPPLTGRQTAIAARWDALEYLRNNFPPGASARIIPAPPFPEFSITFPFDFYNAADKVENSRLWIFTREYQGETGNPYRFQVAVSNGRVIERDGGSLPIPSDGFLLSGHGTGLAPGGSTRLLNWCGIGTLMKLDRAARTITMTTDRDTWFLRCRYLAGKAEGLLKRNRGELDKETVQNAERYLQSTEILLKKAADSPPQSAWAQVRQAMDLARNAMISATLSARDKTFRYIAAPGEISNRQVELIKDAGFKGIMLHYDNASTVNLEGLQRTADYARKLSLEVALWCWLPTRFPVSCEIAEKLPPDQDRNGRNCYFELASNAVRQAYRSELLKICRQLKIKHVMLDYENYRGGYGPVTTEAMRRKYPELPADFTPYKMNTSQQAIWNRYQIELLKAMIDETLESLKSNGISAALCVYPGVKINDLDSGSCSSPGPGVWLPWLKDFDSVILMMYSQSPRWLKERGQVLFPAIRRTAPKIQIDAWLIYWPEICGYANPVPLDNLLRQSDEMLRLKVDGLSFFHSSNLDAQVMPDFAWFFSAMRNGIYRQKSSVGGDPQNPAP